MDLREAPPDAAPDTAGDTTAAEPVRVADETNAARSAPPMPPGSPSPLHIAPDVVRLRDGTRLRGTVAEYRPAAGVTLVLSSGEVRVIPPADVDEVVRLDASTPARGESGAPRASAPPVRVHFDSRGERSLTVYVATGVRARANVRDDVLAQLAARMSDDPEPQGFQVFELLCTAPCARTLEARDHQLGLGIDGGLPVPAGRVSLRTSTRVVVSYDSNASQRAVGAAVALGSLLGLPTVGLMTVAFAADETLRVAGFVSGLVGAMIGGLVGLIIAATGSDAATAATVEAR